MTIIYITAEQLYSTMINSLIIQVGFDWGVCIPINE